MRRKLLTERVLAQIPRWIIEEGLGPADIAKRVGCTVGSLRVRCSRFGISLRQRSNQRPDDYESYGSLTSRARKELILTLPNETRARFQARAAAFGMSEQAFFRLLIETIDRDDLYSAVLDDGKEVDRVPAPRR